MKKASRKLTGGSLVAIPASALINKCIDCGIVFQISFERIRITIYIRMIEIIIMYENQSLNQLGNLEKLRGWIYTSLSRGARQTDDTPMSAIEGGLDMMSANCSLILLKIRLNSIPSPFDLLKSTNKYPGFN